MFPLLADAANPTEMEKWIGPVITALAGVVATLFAWLSSRDRLRFDADVVQMRTDLAYLKTEVSDCHSERDEAKTERDAAKKERDGLASEVGDLRRRMDAIGERHPPA